MAGSPILVVDDDADTCATLTDVLADIGCPADEAYGGCEALEMAERQEYRLALIDYRMPGMSGTDLFQRLRIRDAKIEGILITAHTNSGVAEEAARIGMRALLPKPLDLSKLLPLVDEVLNMPN